MRQRLTVVFAMLVFLTGIAIITDMVARSGWPLGVSVAIWLGVGGVGAVALLGGRALAGAVLQPLERLLADVRQVGVAMRTGARVTWREAKDDPVEVKAIYGATKQLVQDVLAANEQRSVVVAAIGHDLRTSLLSMRNVLGQVAHDRSSGSGRLIGAVRDETQRALRLTEQMMAVFAMGEKATLSERRTMRLRAFVERIVERLRATAGRDRVAVSVRGDVTAECDPGLVERGIENLLTNACRVARSRVDIELRTGVIRIEDDGPGLPPEFADQVRHGVATTRRSQVDPLRVGLGVYIARTAAEQHGGRLVIERSDETGTALLWYYA